MQKPIGPIQCVFTKHNDTFSAAATPHDSPEHHQNHASRSNEDLYRRKRVKHRSVGPEDDKGQTARKHRQRCYDKHERPNGGRKKKNPTRVSDTKTRTRTGLPTDPTTSLNRPH